MSLFSIILNVSQLGFIRSLSSIEACERQYGMEIMKRLHVWQQFVVHGCWCNSWICSYDWNICFVSFLSFLFFLNNELKLKFIDSFTMLFTDSIEHIIRKSIVVRHCLYDTTTIITAEGPLYSRLNRNRMVAHLSPPPWSVSWWCAFFCRCRCRFRRRRVFLALNKLLIWLDNSCNQVQRPIYLWWHAFIIRQKRI